MVGGGSRGGRGRKRDGREEGREIGIGGGVEKCLTGKPFTAPRTEEGHKGVGGIDAYPAVHPFSMSAYITYGSL